MVEEDALVKHAIQSLRVARRVIQAYHKDLEDESFREEPSLTELLMVAQLIGQASAMERLGDIGRPPGEGPVGPPPSTGEAVGSGPPAFFMQPELVVQWDPAHRGWHVLPHHECGEPSFCSSPQQLHDTLNALQGVVAQYRISQGNF